MRLLEQLPAERGDVGYGRDGDAAAVGRFRTLGEGGFLVERRDVDLLETELFGLGDAALNLADRADFPAQADFCSETDFRRDIQVEVGRENGGNDGQVTGRVGHPEAAGDVQEDVFGGEFETGTLLEYGQQHIEPTSKPVAERWGVP